MSASIYDSIVYQRSRTAYSLFSALEYFITLILTDACLSKLLIHIGLTDVQIGIVSSLISVSFLLQLLTVFFGRKIRNVKKSVILYNTVAESFRVSLYFVPFLPLSKELKSLIVIVFLLLYYLLKYFISNIFFKWANSFIAPQKRGRYFANKEMLSLISGMIFIYIIGIMTEHLEQQGQLLIAFFIIAVLGMGCNGGCLYFLTRIGSEEIHSDESSKPSPCFKEIIQNTVMQRNFRNVVILSSLYSMAQYTTLGFMGTYELKELSFSIGTIQLFNIVANGCRFLVSRPFGKYTDKTSYAHAIQISFAIAILAFSCNVFTTNVTRYLIVGYLALYAMSLAGSEQNMYNIVYNYVPNQYFVYASALKNSIAGIFGFLASLIGSAILNTVQTNGNCLFGISLYGQQLLSGISIALLIMAMLFNHFVVEKQKILYE